jgi:hypothetical protein
VEILWLVTISAKLLIMGSGLAVVLAEARSTFAGLDRFGPSGCKSAHLRRPAVVLRASDCSWTRSAA